MARPDVAIHIDAFIAEYGMSSIAAAGLRAHVRLTGGPIHRTRDEWHRVHREFQNQCSHRRAS